MKKMISLVLALMLALAAVSASAASSPKPVHFENSWQNALTRDAGVTVDNILSQESKDAVNALVEAGDLAAGLFANSLFVDEAVNAVPSPFDGRKLHVLSLVPLSAIRIDADKTEGKFAHISTPIPDEMHDVLAASGVKAVLSFIVAKEDGAKQYVSYVLDSFSFAQASQDLRAQYQCRHMIVYSFSIPVLQAAEGCPSFLSLVQV